MGILHRLRVGLSLARGSLTVLRDHPHLLWFPAIGAVAGLVFVVTLLGSVFLAGFGDDGSVVLYATLFVVYVGSTFLAAFTTAGLMHETNRSFHGETPSLRGGLAAAWDHKWQLLAWAVIAAVVGVLIRAIEESSDIAGQILALVFSLAWGVMTYFVVPVIVFEDRSVTGMFKRSGGIVRDVWGESLGAETGIGIVTVLLALVGVAVAAVTFLLVPTGSAIGLLSVLVVGGGAILLAVLVGETLSGIAKTAVYVYATADERPPQFAHVDFGRR